MTKTASTPVRNPSHNYANAQSPIASVKRPRSSLERTPGPTSRSNSNNDDYMTTPQKNPVAEQMSPMHPPRPIPSREEDDNSIHHCSTEGSNADSASWVGRKVDALFSPVLSFLSAAKDEDVAAVTDEDATMEEVPAGAETVAETNSSGADSPNNNSISSSSNASADNNNIAVRGNETDVDALSSQPTTSTVDDADFVDEDDDQDMGGRALEEDPSSSFEEEEFNPFLFIKSLPPYSMVKHTRPPPALAPKNPVKFPQKTTLVLDLDETLVHCTVEPVADADLCFPVVFHGITYQVHVRLRPHLFTFLEKIKDKYEVIIFTASQKVYADELLNLIDKEGKYFHQRLFRESCLSVEGNYLKDLHVLNRDLSRTVLVDNSPHAFGYQVDNGIPIESWFDDPHDTELLKLERFLRTLDGVEDVRTAVRYKFQTYQLVEEA